MRALLIKVWRDLLQRRPRSLLTVLGIAVGVAGVVAIVSTARNVTRAQKALFANTSQADLTYWVWDAPDRLVTLLESDAQIDRAELRVTYLTRWRKGDRWADIELVGIGDLQDVRVNQFQRLAGHLPEAGEILIEDSARRGAAVGVGSEIIYKDASQRERSLLVSGIASSPSYLSSRITRIDLGYVPASAARRLLGISGSNQLLVRVTDPTDAAQVADTVDRLLRRQGIQHGAPEIRNLRNYPGKRELDALIIVMFLFSGLGLVLSSFLVVNTLTATIGEQTAEIGVIKALGGQRSQVLILYVCESLAYGLVGTLLGIAAGALAGWRLLAWIGSLANANIPFLVSPVGVALGALVGLGVAGVGGLIPARRGARLSVKEAISSYGIATTYGEGGLDRLLARVRGLPPLAVMAVRNLARRKGRSALTLMVITLSAASFLGATFARDSVNAAVVEIYETYAADGWMWVSPPQTRSFEGALATVDGVEYAEGWALANGVVGLSEARLWGVPSLSSLYQAVLADGRWFRQEEHDTVVLSSELAEREGLQVGDRVEIETVSRYRSFTVVGIAIDNTIFLGSSLAGKAFVPRETLSRMLGQAHRYSFYALGLVSRDRPIADEALSGLEWRFAEQNPSLTPIYEEIASAEEASRLLTIGMVAMVALVAMVGALGIVNTLTLNVLERRREVGVLRAMGATDAALVISFVGEGLVLGALGWVLAIPVGYLLGALMTRQLSRVLFGLEMVSSPRALVTSLVFTVGLALAASIWPALGAAHTSASDALRYE